MELGRDGRRRGAVIAAPRGLARSGAYQQNGKRQA
jgi:hypothetical protein